MKKTLMVLGLAVAMLATVSHAQIAPVTPVVPKVEVGADYSLIKTNTQYLNGAGVSAAYYFTKNVGLELDFQDYFTSHNQFTLTAGPIFKYRAKHFEPFGEALTGVVNASKVGATRMAFITGGGVDIPINKTIAIRPVQVDYVLTNFGRDYQNNIRYNAGIVFRF